MDQAAYGKRFLLLLFAAFAVLTALNINGSSVVMWSAILDEQKTSKALLYSMPREIRSDEWLVWTPSVLAQARHHPSFPVENPTLGAGRSPMLMNLPTRHYSTLFRPQLWGYFLFDIEHGYAWHWNFKIFGLLAASFLLIRKLAGGSLWLGLLGSVWIFCSSYTQWWFSCPPMLPEMLASWALALWCVIKLGESPQRKAAIPLTCGLVIAAVNFSLCMYPPYQIPMTYLGAVILFGWFWKRRAETMGTIGTMATKAPACWLPEPRWLVIAAVAIALVLIPFFVQLLPTLHMVEHTSYPGARRTTGGALSATDLFMGLVEPFSSADHFPEQRGNICAVANFYPIWIAAAFWLVAASRNLSIAAKRLLWPLFGSVFVFTLFALCPLPSLFCRITLLSLCTEERMILPIGIGGILLSILALREMDAKSIPSKPLRIALFYLCGGLSTFFIWRASLASPEFFDTWRLVEARGLSWILFALFLWPQKRAFAVVLLIAVMPTILHCNPVTRGLAPLTETSAFSTIDQIRRSDPNARWVTFDGAIQSGLLMSAGVDVLSGAKTLPDLDFYREIDPDQSHLRIYNRYSLGLFHIAPTPDMVRFRLFDFCAHDVVIHPTNPALRKRNVRYFVCPGPLKNPAAAGLQSLVRMPARHIWIYRLKETPPAA